MSKEGVVMRQQKDQPKEEQIEMDFGDDFSKLSRDEKMALNNDI
jgi:hypothetical protein